MKTWKRFSSSSPRTAREILRLLVSGGDDPERLAELDARAAVLRATISAARPRPEDAPLSLMRDVRPEDR